MLIYCKNFNRLFILLVRLQLPYFCYNLKVPSAGQNNEFEAIAHQCFEILRSKTEKPGKEEVQKKNPALPLHRIQ